MSFGGIKVTSADRLCSLYVRYKAKWYCEICGMGFANRHVGLHCSHYFSRSRKSTRYHLPNLIAACVNCHKYLGSHHTEYEAMMRKRLGEKGYRDLLIQWNKVEKDDVKLWTLIYRKLLKDDFGIKV